MMELGYISSFRIFLTLKNYKKSKLK